MIMFVLVAALLAPAQASQAQTGTITGQLLNNRGLPAVGVRVAAMPVPREGEQNSVPTTLLGLGLTDNNGRYTIEMIEPGTYYVMAGRIDEPSYYPGVSALSSAKPILVTTGARISGVDFRADPLTHIASGRIRLPSGHQPAPGYLIMLAGARSYSTVIRPDGTFEFGGVMSGGYTLKLMPEAFSLAMPVVVEDRNVTGIEFPDSGVVTVSGRVAMEGAGESPEVSVAFVAKNGMLEVATRRQFAFFAPEGEIRATVKSVSNGFRVKSFTAGAVDLLRNSLKLSSTDSVAALTVTLEAVPTVAFAGRVVSSRGGSQPLHGIRMEGETMKPLAGTVQSDGSFAFDRIAPGDYTATMLVARSEEFKVAVTVPSEGRRDAEIVIPELHPLSVRLGIEPNVPATARPIVTLRFVDTAGAVTPLVADGSAGDVPLRFSLREGQYRVTATIREAVTGTGITRLKTLSSGTIDLLTSPLVVAGDVEEIRITIGR